jgi:hypothetical protein
MARVYLTRSFVVSQLITGLSNLEVAQYLVDAQHKLQWCEGVVFLDEDDKKMILVRATGRVQELDTCGIATASRFAFYDQVRIQCPGPQLHDYLNDYEYRVS